jgi:hypothetical protein
VDANTWDEQCTALWGNGRDIFGICQNGDSLSVMTKFPAGSTPIGIWSSRATLNGGSYGVGSALWGTADGRIVITGYDGQVGKGFVGFYQGSLVATDPMGTFQFAAQFDDQPNALWASSASDVWVAGLGIYHWDGTSTSLTRSPIQLDNYLGGIAGDSGGAIWAVGENNTILRHAPGK